MSDSAGQVAAHWGSSTFTEQLARVQWMASPIVQLHLNALATGSPARDWLTAWAPRFFPDGPLRVLVLGCGEGWLERALIRNPAVAQIEAVDLAADAVARARELAQNDNIRYRVADLNTEVLEPGAYDVIIAHSILHHVERLEHAFAQIAAALKPGGAFLMNEYAGPARFQFSDNVLSIITELFAAIPARYRGAFTEKARPGEAEVIAADPSEAIRSDEVLPVALTYFTLAERINLGGTVLQHLLYGLVPHLGGFEDSVGRSVVELLCIFEKALIDAYAIPSDYVLVSFGKARRSKLDLPPLPPEAKAIGSDPLGFGRKRRIEPAGEGPQNLDDWILRALRVALLAERPKRSILNPESKMRAAIERWRCRGRAFDHVLARVSADSELIPLLTAMRRIWVHSRSDG